MHGRCHHEISKEILAGDIGEGSAEALAERNAIDSILRVGIGYLRKCSIERTSAEGQRTYGFMNEVVPFFARRAQRKELWIRCILSGTRPVF